MCRVAGNPAPKVTWYHNKIPIEVSMHGIGKYKITQDNGIHYLEISRAQDGFSIHFHQVFGINFLKIDLSSAMPEIIDVLPRIILVKFLIMLLLL